MDTTYFERSFGIMVLMDSISGKALSVSEVKYETNEQYFTAIGSLKAKGIEIQSIVCDGRRGLAQMFADIPVQLCQFHQVKTIARYLTRNPKTEAYFSLKRNLDDLFVFERYPDLNLPNTTNLLDGTFSDMKRLLACHHGMRKGNKIRFIQDYFSVKNS